MSVEKRKVIVSFNDDGSPVCKWLKAYSQDEMHVKIVKAFVESGRIKEIIPSLHFEGQTEKGIKLRDYAFEWLKRKRKLKENRVPITSFSSLCLPAPIYWETVI